MSIVLAAALLASPVAVVAITTNERVAAMSRGTIWLENIHNRRADEYRRSGVITCQVSNNRHPSECLLLRKGRLQRINRTRGN